MQDVLDEVAADIEREEAMRAQHANQKKQVGNLVLLFSLRVFCLLKSKHVRHYVACTAILPLTYRHQ